LFFGSFIFAINAPTQAQLTTVGPIDPANGFPLWYRDSNGLGLQLCLSQAGFCFTSQPNPSAPISFPGNFGDEAFYFMASSDMALPGGGLALLSLALEAAFLNGNAQPDNQLVFARVRIRIDAPQSGTYKVIHPYGKDTFSSVVAGTRAINFTEDVGIGVAHDFQTALKARVGPFLVSTRGQVTDALGEPFLANPAVPTTVTGSPFGTNVFRIEGPGMGGPGVDFLETDQFTLMGKILTVQPAPSPNPVAVDDRVTTAGGTPVVIDVLANDLPGSQGHPLSPSTVRVVTPPANGTASVRSNGLITFTPGAGFSGNATFTYLVRDSQSTPSNTATVTVVVTLANQPPGAPGGRELTAAGPVDPANGFPLWYQDSTGITLQHCLSQTGFCFTSEPNPGAPITFPGNFGDENFYFLLEADLTLPNNGRALLILALESSFLNGVAVPGDQIVFARFRARIDIPQNGTYKVIHPYGEEVFPNLTAGRRAINVTEDVGIGLPGDFQAALGGRVGPFLVSTRGPVEDALGDSYLANPAVPTTITGSPFGTNVFRIEGPGIGGPGVDSIETNQFTLMGKVFSGMPMPPAILGGPKAMDDHVTTPHDTPVAINVCHNDLAGAGKSPVNSSTLRVLSQPRKGSLLRATDGLLTYSPDAGYFGSDTFTYVVRDAGMAFSNLAAVSITVLGPPGATDDLATTSQNQAVIIDVLLNDLPGPNGNPLDPSTLEIGNTPLHGDAAVNAPDRTVTYTPNPDFFGTDSFTYTVRDTGRSLSNRATVTVTTFSPPVAADDIASTFKNTPVLIDILGNDLTGSGGLSLSPATVNIVSPPSGGDAEIDPSDGSVTYIPHLDFLGPDSFTYVVQDTGKALSNTATVSLSVKKPPISQQDLGLAAVGPINSATGFPLWYQDKKGVALEHCLSQSGFCFTSEPSSIGVTAQTNSALYFLASASLDLPGGGHALLVLALESAYLNGTPEPGTEITFARVRIELDMPQSGTYKVIHPYGEDFFTSIAGARRAVNFTEDAGGGSPGDFSRALSGRIAPFLASTAGPVTDALGDLYLADPTKPTTVSGSLFGTNFFRIEGPGIGGPGVDFMETDQFTLMGKILGPSPVAVSDSATTREESSVVIDVAGNDLPGFGGNAIDPTTVQLTDAPANGSATVNPADGKITYSPRELFFGKDTFRYAVQDSAQALSNPATVTVTITFVNHPPVAADDRMDIRVSEPIEIDVRANDSDLDNNLTPGSVSIVSPPQFGTAVVNGSGGVTYISTPQISSADTFTYNVRDAESEASNTATVILTPIQKPFIRCDANHDKVIDISDPVSVLRFLFTTRGTYPCLDALDADDSGLINLTDAVFILLYLFQGGSVPPQPFPQPGLDGTEDDPYFCH
jgi:hypothetical protein